MALDLYYVDDTDGLVSFGAAIPAPDPDPDPDPPFTVFLPGDVEIQLDDFGITGALVPYNDTAGPTPGQEATFDVDVDRPFLLET
jgi:hypothetical protein